jgi:hypothetical protein
MNSISFLMNSRGILLRFMWTYTMLGQFDRAEQLMNQSLDLMSSVGLAEQDYFLHNQAVLHIRQRHYPEALQTLALKDQVINDIIATHDFSEKEIKGTGSVG